ncbi:MAG TPA: DUF2231 domain-containing protein [Polyangiaceae bacterium]
MESRTKILGHPVHQVLVPFPIGAFGLSVAFDAFHTMGGPRWHLSAARRAVELGLITGILAAPFGFADWLAIEKQSRAKRIGLVHAATNAVMLGVFAKSRWLRRSERTPTSAKWISATGLLLGGCAAWFGGELIVRHGVGVNAVPLDA